VVVRLKEGKSVRGALSYNEQKVTAGKAELILASRFGCELSVLGFNEKLNRFEQLNRKRQRGEINTLHLSLNFSPYDQIDTEKMQAIALDYMKRIGFGDQPFLVYRHDDANHPHVHIVTSTVKPNGRPINVHRLGIRLSEPARKAIEKGFNLIPAASMKKEAALPLIPVALEKAQYGQGETKRVISNIVREVTSRYHFTSLDELNAILKDFNVLADPGRPGSRIRDKGGLVYSIIDSYGNKVGIPIKASAIYSQPTLAFLTEKFKRDFARKHLYINHTARAVNDILLKPGKINENRFQSILAKRKVHCHFIKDEDGRLLDIRFVDHFSKVVLNCHDIKLSTHDLLDRIIPSPHQSEVKQPHHSKDPETQQQKQEAPISHLTMKLMKGLFEQENGDHGVSSEFLKKKKKRRKRGF
jgi:Relaxase/Mobilisation nuclease domain.